MPVLVAEIEHVEQVADGGHVEWHVRITYGRDRIGQIIAAALGQRLQMPVPLDELHNRRMVGVGVHHVAAARVFGHGDHGNARPVAEEVDRLEEARIPVAAALVKGDEEGGLLEEVRMCLEPVEDRSISASRRSSFELAGWPSSKLSGFK
jgi:hypothetical protein